MASLPHHVLLPHAHISSITLDLLRLESVLACGVMNGSNCIFFYIVIRLFQHRLLESPLAHKSEMLPLRCTEAPSAAGLSLDSPSFWLRAGPAPGHTFTGEALVSVVTARLSF